MKGSWGRSQRGKLGSKLQLLKNFISQDRIWNRFYRKWGTRERTDKTTFIFFVVSNLTNKTCNSTLCSNLFYPEPVSVHGTTRNPVIARTRNPEVLNPACASSFRACPSPRPIISLWNTLSFPTSRCARAWSNTVLLFAQLSPSHSWQSLKCSSVKNFFSDHLI